MFNELIDNDHSFSHNELSSGVTETCKETVYRSRLLSTISDRR